MKKQSVKISCKQTTYSLSFDVTVALVAMALVVPTAPIVPKKGQTAAVPTTQTPIPAGYTLLRQLVMNHLKRSAKIGILNNDSRGVESIRSMYSSIQTEKMIEIFGAGDASNN